jgi:D-3-phosphoglycerate dehydrogenase
MEVIAYDPAVAAEAILTAGVRLAGDLPALLRAADIVTLHVPHTASTHHLIDAAALAAMKPGAFLINASRGRVVDEQALIEALANNELAGAAVDVFDSEPPSPDTRSSSFPTSW